MGAGSSSLIQYTYNVRFKVVKPVAWDHIDILDTFRLIAIGGEGHLAPGKRLSNHIMNLVMQNLCETQT